ncbi:MAG: hypothetical protein D6701_07990 [Gemmatimonadetes bacterium]|nr:MAG: hypothetical protein D6701_07990 [Gemmatimonadota bacterium]
MKRFHPGLLLLTTVALAACSDDGAAPLPEADDAGVAADVAVVAADAAIEDLRSMIDIGSFGLGAPAAMVEDERTVSRSITFFDAEGNEQDRYDPVTTASARIEVEINAEVSREGWSASVERHKDLTVSGLEGDETTRVWNGSGTDEVHRSRHTDEDGTRSYELNGTFSIDNVVRGVPRSENPWPLSGSITREVTVEITNGPNGDETRTMTAVLTFNGTQFATLVVDGETFEVDLAARDGRSPFRRPRGDG